MKKLKYLIPIIIFILRITPVLAETKDIVDFSKKGTIKLNLINPDNTYIEGINIKITKLASATSKNYNLSFNYYEELSDYKDKLNKNDLNKELLDIIHNSNLYTKERKSNKNGTITFNDLELGLYLVEQTNQIEGYSNIIPFLIYIPIVENSKWIYKVDATPKIDIIKLFDLTVSKIWNVPSNVQIPKEVTIELSKDNVVIDTIKLNKENNWTYTWSQIEQKDTYSIKEINIPIGYTPTYKKDNNKFIVTNTKTLLQTGYNKWTSIFIGIIGIIFLLIGSTYNKKEINK